MSGPVANNIFRSSGVVAAAAGGLSWQPVVTASTLSASAGNGYFINTTSNACTITLPSSAEAGDQIIFVDYARTWGTNEIIIDSNGLNFQGEDDTYTVDYDTSGQALNLVYSGATIGWTPSSDIVNALEPVAPPTQRAIFGYGNTGSKVSLSNLVNSSGVVASDTTGVGTARGALAAASYGGDKAIFGYGSTGSMSSITNLVNSSGVVGSDVTGVGTARSYILATTYGLDKAIFGYGEDVALGAAGTKITNLVSNVGVVATDTAASGTTKIGGSGVGYGSTGQAIFGYGYNAAAGGVKTITNLVSNLGVVATDTSGVGTARSNTGSCSYGGDKAIFAYGSNNAGGSLSVSNLVSNLGIVQSDVTGVGTARYNTAAAGYGGDKGIFGFGNASGSMVSMTNLVNSSGVVATDVSGVGTARAELGVAGYSYSA